MIILLIRKFIRLFQIEIQNHRQRCDEPAAGKMQDLIKAKVGIPVIAASNQGGKIRKDRRHDVDFIHRLEMQQLEGNWYNQVASAQRRRSYQVHSYPDRIVVIKGIYQCNNINCRTDIQNSLQQNLTAFQLILHALHPPASFSFRSSSCLLRSDIIGLRIFKAQNLIPHTGKFLFTVQIC